MTTRRDEDIQIYFMTKMFKLYNFLKYSCFRSRNFVLAKLYTREMPILHWFANFKNLGDREILYPRNVNFAWFAKFSTSEFQNSGCSRNCIPAKCQFCLDSRSLIPANFKNLGDREILYPRNVNFAWFAKFNTREFQKSGWSRNFVPAKCQFCLIREI